VGHPVQPSCRSRVIWQAPVFSLSLNASHTLAIPLLCVEKAIGLTQSRNRDLHGASAHQEEIHKLLPLSGVRPPQPSTFPMPKACLSPGPLVSRGLGTGELPLQPFLPSATPKCSGVAAWERRTSQSCEQLGRPRASSRILLHPQARRPLPATYHTPPKSHTEKPPGSKVLRPEAG